MRSSFPSALLALAALSLAWASPVLETPFGEPDTAPARLEAALESEGLRVAQRFDVAAGLAGRGQSFAPYLLLTLEADEALAALLAARPELATAFPLTVYLYAPEGEARAGVLRPLAAWELADADAAVLAEHHARVLAALGLGDADPVPFGGPLIATRFVPGLDAETAALFLEAALSGQNLNVVGGQQFGEARQLSACSLGYAAAILGPLPAFGALAPCRVVLYPDAGGARVALLDVAALGALYDLPPEVAGAVQEAYGLLLTALADLGAQ